MTRRRGPPSIEEERQKDNKKMSNRRFTPHFGPCPVCGLQYTGARAALACWLQHDPDIRSRLSLQAMADNLGVTRERVHQLLRGRPPGKRAPAGQPRQRRIPSTDQIQRYTQLAAEHAYVKPIREWRRPASPEQRERWRIKARDRYRNDPKVREAAKRRYEERWRNDPSFREAHRRRASARYYRLRLQQILEATRE